MVKRLALALILFLSTLANTAWTAESEWQSAAELEIAPRSKLVVLVHQHGIDLALQVRSAREVVLEQDGPDPAYGTEVLLLENPGASTASFELFVRPVLNGLKPGYAIEQVANPTGDDQLVAKRLSEVSRKWLGGAATSEMLPLVNDPAALRPSRFRALTINTCVDLFVRSAQGPELIEFLIEHPATDRGVAFVDRVYRNLQLANSLWNANRIEDALRIIDEVAYGIETSRGWRSIPEPTRRWLEVNVAATRAAMQIFVGRHRGDNDLMDRGGTLIDTTLRSVATNPDYTLRAKLAEYMAGYYNLRFDRSNNITAGLYRETAELYERAGDRASLAPVRNNQAYAELGRGNIDAALRLYLESLELQKTSRHREGQAYVRARLGYVYYTIGDYRRAEIRLKEAIELYQEIKLPLKAVHTQLQLAELWHADNRSGEALALLEKLRSNLWSKLSMEDQLRLATQLAAIRTDQGDIDAAERTLAALGDLDRFDSNKWPGLQRSVRLFYLLDFEIVRARIELANGATVLAERRVAAAFDWLGGGNREPLRQLHLLQLQLTILERTGDEQAFASTGNRALALIESIRGDIDFHTQGPAWSARTSGINDLLVSHYLARYESGGRMEDFDRAFELLETARARNLREMRAGAFAHEAVEESTTTRELEKARQDLIRALLLEESSEPLARRFAKAEEQYLRLNPPKRPSRPMPAILDGASVRRQLDPQTQVAVFFAGKSRSYALLLSRDSVSMVRLPKAANLKALTAASEAELAKHGDDLPRTRQLAQVLFPAASTAGRHARMLVEADGVFSGVPFSVLLDLLAKDTTPPAVTVVPSLSEMFGPGASPTQPVSDARKDLVIFADPAFVLSGAPQTTSPWRNSFSRLPYTQVEAKSISEYFASDSVLMFSDKNATIGNILAEPARTARVLHIAAHGFGSASDPFVVGLGLAADLSDGGSGLLTTQHIGATRYANELIVVSACESGQGQLLDGEGLMSVARSFLASGAKATLSTLWPVPDRANAEFMKEFYFSLTQRGSEPAVALVEAQQKMKGSDKFDHPYYWGGFVLHVVDSRYRPIDPARVARR